MDAKALREYLNNLTQEEIDEIRNKYFRDETPHGWVSIEEHLPMMKAIDIRQGYSVFQVRDVHFNVFEAQVSDHNTWYYYAKELGITHWFNEKVF